jgi:acetylornithine deacetylase/succinyl-diaminopimelate desuccinylase-like protein
MDTLIDGKRATWEVGTLNRRSWTGMEISYHPFHMAWRIEPEHELVKACTAAYSESFGREPAGFGFWDFSTNAVIPVSLGIPTIGFGPGNARLAHMRNEHCEVRQILEACEYYASLMSLI